MVKFLTILLIVLLAVIAVLWFVGKAKIMDFVSGFRDRGDSQTQITDEETVEENLTMPTINMNDGANYG